MPSRIESVVPARPGVQSFLLAVCPEKVRALAYEPHDFEARANYPENLPIVGALFRRSSRGIQDAFSILPPDVLVDIENESDWAAGVADDLQLRSGLPVVTIKRSWSNCLKHFGISIWL